MKRICGAGSDQETNELKRKFNIWMHEDTSQKLFAEQAKNYVQKKVESMVLDVHV